MAAYYVDYNRGSDSAAGTSRAAAWQNLSKLASQTLSSGDTVFLASDSTWNIASRVLLATIAGTQSSPCTITSYVAGGASASKPTISYNFDIASSEWTYDAPNNGWYKDLGFPVGRMARIVLGGRYYANYYYDSPPLPSTERAFTKSSNLLYVYAPSTTDPTTYYGSVNVGPSDRGALTLSNNGAYCVFDGIKFENSGTGILAFGSSGTRFLVVRNCEANNGAPLLFINTITGGEYGFLFEKNSGYGAVSGFFHCQDAGGVGMGNWIARDNKFSTSCLGYPQGAMYIQVRGAYGLVERNWFSDAKYGTNLQINDGCAVYVEAGANNVLVRGNYVENSHCAMQDNSGRTATFIGNIFNNCRMAMKVTDESNNSATVHTFQNNTIINGGIAIPPVGPNSVSGTGWWAYETTTPAMTLNITNNIFHAHPDAYGTNAIETPVSALGTIANNAYFGYSGIAESYLGGSASPTPTGTINADPKIGNNFNTYSASLRGAGVTLGGLDFHSKEFGAFPNIGASQTWSARSMSSRSTVFRSVASRLVNNRRAIAGA